MFLLVRLLRPFIVRASGRALVAGAAGLTVAVAVLLVAGFDTHDHIEVRVGIALAIAGAFAARIAVRSRRASNNI